MKKLLIITGAVLIAYVVLISVLTPAPAVPAAAAAPSAPDAEYVLCEDNGRVAVYRGDTLYLKTETRVDDLPRADRTRIRQGITVSSLKELKRLLEDYCS